MDHWLRIAPQTSVQSIQQLNGVEFNVVVSPYAVPEAVRGRRDERSDRFIIEFRYVDGPEPSREQYFDDKVSCLFGRHSNRLLAIKVDVDSLGVDAVKVNLLRQPLEATVEHVWARIQQMPNVDRSNASLAQAGWKSNRQELVRQMVG